MTRQLSFVIGRNHCSAAQKKYHEKRGFRYSGGYAQNVYPYLSLCAVLLSMLVFAFR